ncbi:energy transducer TonB [Desulfogranum japonicum]|uniref:energy transducer TonB n=1 Tax=Desulfogranum japonicum TaxID=231447 RepID=UPI0003F58E3D|nr:energy transducer TonB [Desulfogranum japonicum]
MHFPHTQLNWPLALAGTLCCNMFIFLLLPLLISKKPPELIATDMIEQVQLIRLQKETPPKPPEEHKQPKPLEKEKPKPSQQKIFKEKLQLALDLNPRLPKGPTTLELPPPDLNLQGVSGDAIFEVGDLDAPLTTVARIPPLYPLKARRRGIEGWVKVRLLVNEQGDVSGVTILEAQPDGIFEKSVRNCVVSWRFQPGTVDGVPVKAQVETVIHFTLE